MKIKLKVSGERKRKILTNDQRTAMLLLGDDLTRLLEVRGHSDVVIIAKEIKISSNALHMIMDGRSTGESVALATIYIIAATLRANVEVNVPSDDWNNKTSLADLWSKGATIRLIPRP